MIPMALTQMMIAQNLQQAQQPQGQQGHGQHIQGSPTTGVTSLSHAAGLSTGTLGMDHHSLYYQQAAMAPWATQQAYGAVTNGFGSHMLAQYK